MVKKLKKAAKAKGLEFEEINLTNHGAIRIGKTTRTLGRHSEIRDNAAREYFKQFENELGKGWWRK